jgi:hypothetical protein
VRVPATCMAAIHSIRLLQAMLAGFVHALFPVNFPSSFPCLGYRIPLPVSELVFTGIVNPDVSCTVPAIFLATGRVVDHHRSHLFAGCRQRAAARKSVRKAAFEPAGA